METVIAQEDAKREIGAEQKDASRDEISEISYRVVLSSDKDFIERTFLDYYKKRFSYSAPKVMAFGVCICS